MVNEKEKGFRSLIIKKMDLLRKLFNRKTPDGLHEICDQVFGLFVSLSSYAFLLSVFGAKLYLLPLSSEPDCLKKSYFSFFMI